MKFQFVGSRPTSVNIPEEIRQKVVERIKQCIETIKHSYQVEIPMPTITYDLRGTTAGIARVDGWLIKLNSILLMENVEDFLATTTPHEFAHLAAFKIYGPHQNHGMGWRNVMHVLGVRSDRCHTYDVRNSRMRRR